MNISLTPFSDMNFPAVIAMLLGVIVIGCWAVLQIFNDDTEK